jgi:hypothetical protein
VTEAELRREEDSREAGGIADGPVLLAVVELRRESGAGRGGADGVVAEREDELRLDSTSVVFVDERRVLASSTAGKAGGSGKLVGVALTDLSLLLLLLLLLLDLDETAEGRIVEVVVVGRAVR